ncbi:MAG: DUF4446 family protein, partial [Nocardioidaceae bacterium]
RVTRRHAATPDYPRSVPPDTTTTSWLAIAALVVAVAALVVAVAAWRRSAKRRKSTADHPRTTRRRAKAEPLSTDEVTAQIQSLQTDVATSLRHLAVVRYDAFGDMGGHLSWSVALLDDGGDGVVLTSIHGRSDSRTYAKNISSWSANQQLSPEEEEAIGFARSSHD